MSAKSTIQALPKTKTYELRTPALTKDEQAIIRQAVALKRSEKAYKKLEPMVRAIVQRHGAVETNGAMFALGSGVSYTYSKALEKMAEELKAARKEAQENGKAKKSLKPQLEFTDKRALAEKEAEKQAQAKRDAKHVTKIEDDEIPGI